jgi:hypothetical protein
MQDNPLSRFTGKDKSTFLLYKPTFPDTQACSLGINV